jgi:GABA permease
MPIQTEHDPRLKRSLKTRHLTMMSLGGVIGAGLFVGSSAIISEAGPSTFLIYGITGILVGLVMRMLGEMAAAHPTTGSFTDYTRMAFGNWAGFSTGWMYWYFWVIVVGFEAVVGGQIINGWVPAIPAWAISLGLMLIMTAVNLLSVGSFGEAEYWFAGVKIVAIVAFIIVTTLYVFHALPNSTASLSNLTAHGGFFPNGWQMLFSGIVVVIFSMTGVEVATIAAAESDEPAKNVARAVRSVVVRIIAFFVLSTLLIVIAQPWTAIEAGKSPFVATLNKIGIPGAGTMLTVVILVAVLSVLNAGIYTSSRLLFVLSSRGEAPRWMTTTNRRGVPVKGILFCTLVGYACVVIAAMYPDTVFLFLINSSGAVFLFVYLMICIAQIKLRPRFEKEGRLQFKMWGYPWLPGLVTAAIVAVLVSMAFDEANRVSLWQSLLAWAVILIAYGVLRLARRSGSPEGAVDLDAAAAPADA